MNRESEPSVVIRYRTKKDYCGCCNQKLPSPKISNTREYKITKKNAISWSEDWNEIAKYPEDMASLVSEFVFESVRFWETSSDERVLIEDEEIEKVAEFILTEVIDNK